MRREGGGLSDHHLVEGRLRVGTSWVRGRRERCGKEVVKVRELENGEKLNEYQGKVAVEWNAVKDQEEGNIEEKRQVF